MMGWRVIRSHFPEHFGQPVDGIDGCAVRAGEDANSEERAVNQRIRIIEKDGLRHVRRTYHAAGNKTTRSRTEAWSRVVEWTRRLTSSDSQRSAMNRIARGIDQPGGHKDQQV